ncbi:membrane protein [Actinoplanes cyaneus]|uniref:Membrane protein n=1 Tax=Actinoplanes cyaneus TaxID=52696 RepID=A0A919IQI8_9ACTN|nr:putative drug exporter of the RND superfamily [Actinoplanes cyaneus]GID69361.1 membrane protein [Actinoplanes cyaneus]
MGLWIAFVAACLAIGSAVPARTATSVESTVGQAAQAERMLRAAGLADPASENILITARSGRLDVNAAQAAAAAVNSRLSNLPEVAQIGIPVTAEGKDAVLLPVVLRGDPDTAVDRIAAVHAATDTVAAQFPALRVAQTGNASLTEGLAEQSTKDLDAAGAVSLPLTLVILLVVFGALLAAGVPLLLGLSAVAAAFGLSSLMSHLLPSTGTTSAMILLMGMAVGVDYSLFYVKRYRDERARSHEHLDAVRIAVQTSGHSVLVSGIAVIVAMLGLFFVQDVTFSSLAASSVMVVTVAMLGSLTVLPALLAGLGRVLDRPRVPVLWRLATRTREPRLWPFLLRPSLRRPSWTLAAAVLGMLALTVPALSMTLSQPDIDALPRAVPEVATLRELTKAFPDEQARHKVVVTAPATQADQVEQRLRTLRGDVGGTSLRASSDRRVHELILDTDADAESAQAHDQVESLRERLPETLRGIDATWAVGGDTASSMDYTANLDRALPWVVGFVILATAMIIVVAFRSLVLALVTAVSNLLSVGAAFGVITLVFQHIGGGKIVSFVPLFAFAVLSGLSMDYHVFVLTRIRELVTEGLPTRQAVARGITESAGTVTSAAAVMVAVFSVFILGNGIEFQQLGVGLSSAVLIDALVIRALVLPAALTMLGPRTWWPSRPQPHSPAGTPAPQQLVEGESPTLIDATMMPTGSTLDGCPNGGVRHQN